MSAPPPPPSPQLLRLAALVQLEQRARRAAPAELAFAIVNETHGLLPYRQAVLFDATGHVEAVSGVAQPDADGPYLQWLAHVLRALPVEAAGSGPDAEPLPVRFGAAGLPAALATDWVQWLPEHGLCVPLHCAPAQPAEGTLLLFRAEPWSDAERQLLALLAGSYAQARRLARLAARRPWNTRLPHGRRALAPAGALLALAVLAGWPIRQSVLAPAELVPRAPALVRAPIEGVVESFQIEPNQRVTAGQPLLRLDATEVRSKLEVATRAREVAAAEYQTAAQQAFTDARAKATLATLAGRVEQQAAERDYYAALLDRLQLRAPQDGIAIFDDPNDWLGRPVAVGQKILVVARPDDLELEVHLPAADPLALEPGAELLFFPNVAPDRPLGARLRVVGYSAVPGADGVAAYRLKASLDAGAGTGLRPGLRGTARIYGADTALGAWLLRRPLAVLARWLNL